jgi:peptidoglycan-associated lipoprotein
VQSFSRYIVVSAFFALACGGTTNEEARRNAGGTGSDQREHARFSGSGGEVGAGDCSIAPVYFAYDSSELDGRARAGLESSARCLTARNAGAQVTGMTDPRGTEEYNLALGDRRARTAAQYLTNLGVDDVSTHSVGEEHARGDEDSEWAEDRRADVRTR